MNWKINTTFFLLLLFTSACSSVNSADNSANAIKLDNQGQIDPSTHLYDGYPDNYEKDHKNDKGDDDSSVTESSVARQSFTINQSYVIRDRKNPNATSSSSSVQENFHHNDPVGHQTTEADAGPGERHFVSATPVQR